MTSSISAISWTLPKIRQPIPCLISINFIKWRLIWIFKPTQPLIVNRVMWCMRILNVWAWGLKFQSNWPSYLILWLTINLFRTKNTSSASWTIRVTASHTLLSMNLRKNLLSMSPSPTAVTGIIWPIHVIAKQMTVIRPSQNYLTTSASALIRLAKILTTSPFLVNMMVRKPS